MDAFVAGTDGSMAMFIVAEDGGWEMFVVVLIG